jgi:hypothetical protein
MHNSWNNLGRQLVKNQQVGSQTKHIDIQYHYIQEMREQRLVDVIFVGSEHNTSDILTKTFPEKLLWIHGRNIWHGT